MSTHDSHNLSPFMFTNTHVQFLRDSLDKQVHVELFWLKGTAMVESFDKAQPYINKVLQDALPIKGEPLSVETVIATMEDSIRKIRRGKTVKISTHAYNWRDVYAKNQQFLDGTNYGRWDSQEREDEVFYYFQSCHDSLRDMLREKEEYIDEYTSDELAILSAIVQQWEAVGEDRQSKLFQEKLERNLSDSIHKLMTEEVIRIATWVLESCLARIERDYALNHEGEL